MPEQLWRYGKEDVWDYMCTSTVTDVYLQYRRAEGSEAAIYRKIRKTNIYTSLEHYYRFVLIGTKNLSACGKCALKFPKEVGEELVRQTWDARAASSRSRASVSQSRAGTPVIPLVRTLSLLSWMGFFEHCDVCVFCKLQHNIIKVNKSIILYSQKVVVEGEDIHQVFTARSSFNTFHFLLQNPHNSIRGGTSHKFLNISGKYSQTRYKNNKREGVMLTGGAR